MNADVHGIRVTTSHQMAADSSGLRYQAKLGAPMACRPYYKEIIRE